MSFDADGQLVVDLNTEVDPATRLLERD